MVSADVGGDEVTMRYKTILVDPPWPERGGGKVKRGADRHYPLLSLAEILALPVGRLVHPEGCHLYLWTTNRFFGDALLILAWWGFEYRTTITWAKQGNIGLGQYFRGKTEHCLFGVRGRLPYRTREDGKRSQGKTLILAPKRGHSEKPEELRSMAEVVSHGPRVELFARRRVRGWDAWGDEIESTPHVAATMNKETEP